MGGLVLLGLVASVFLVFSDSLQFVRIGLVAALWAAAIGALAATRFRKEAAVDKAKVRDLQTVYELQLEREITARREYELGVEARVREEVGADATEMAALRAELTVLRESLHRLFDGDLLVERPALRADAVRVQELESGRPDTANGNSGNADQWGPHLPHPPHNNLTPIFDDDHPEIPNFASPYDDPVTAETSVVASDGRYGEDDSDFDDGYVPGAYGDFDDGYREVDYRIEDYDTGGYRIDMFAGPDYDTEDTAAGQSWSDAFTESEDPARAPAAATRVPGSPTRPGTPEAGPGPAPMVGNGVASRPTAVAGDGLASRPSGPPANGVGATSPRPVGAAAPNSARPAESAPSIGTAGARRRRRGEDTEAPDSKQLSVAEIMANLRSESGDPGADRDAG